MSNNSFVKIAQELQNRVPREIRLYSGATVEELKEENLRLREILQYQEDKIKRQGERIDRLTEELGRRNLELEIRERACREKEEELKVALAKFDSAKEKIGEVMAKTRQEMEELEYRKQLQEQLEEKLSRQSDVLQKANQRIRELEEKLRQVDSEPDTPVCKQEKRTKEATPYMPETKAEPKEELHSEEVPIGYTPVDESQIYMRGRLHGQHGQESRFQEIESRLNGMAEDFSTIKEYLKEVSSIIKQATQQQEKSRFAATTSTEAAEYERYDING